MYQRVDLPDRQWPNNEITKAPIWMSTDLRDGNQAIFEPMNMEQKFKMFKMLVKLVLNILKSASLLRLKLTSILLVC